MAFSFSFLAVALALAAIPPTRSAEFTVTVGGPGGVVAYNPPFVNASIGDVVTFVFQQKNHTVTQSSFASPCTPLANGFDSGFIPVSENTTSGFQTAQLTVQDTNPIWVYCRQANHCQAGMVFAVNPGAKFDAFKATAMGQTANSTSGSAAPATSTTVASGTTFTSVSAPASSASPTSSSSSGTSSTSSLTNDHRIIVGNAGTLTFSPSNISAQVGDTITFEFHAKNHTATQSTFAAPCVPLAQSSQNGQTGFNSGFMAVDANATTFPTMTIQVNDTAPIWVFCAQTGHCGKGMVFAVNAIESSANNFDAFVQRAESLNGTSSTSSGAGRAIARVTMPLALASAVGGILLGMLL